MKRLLPLVRFNLMETQFFRQDPFSKKIISTLASGELFDSTLSLDQRWRRRWSASSILEALLGANSLF